MPRDGTMTVEGSGLAGAAVRVDYTDKGGERHEGVSVSDSEYYADEDKLDFGGADWEVLCKSMQPGSEVTLKVTTDAGTASITGTSDAEEEG